MTLQKKSRSRVLENTPVIGAFGLCARRWALCGGEALHPAYKYAPLSLGINEQLISTSNMSSEPVIYPHPRNPRRRQPVLAAVGQSFPPPASSFSKFRGLPCEPSSSRWSTDRVAAYSSSLRQATPRCSHLAVPHLDSTVFKPLEP
jgi:hypothetical protein